METRYADHEDDDMGVFGVAIIVFIVIIIIILIFYFAFRGTGVIYPILAYTGSGSSASETFVADNFTVFTASAPLTGMSLAITAPVDPIGKQFIIDNSTGVGVVTLTGVTLQNSAVGANKVLAKSVGVFAWKTATVILRIS